MNLFQKLVEVRRTVEYLKKENKGQQYKYVSSSQVLASLRDKMNELNLLLVPKVAGHNLLESTVEYMDGNKPKRTTTYFTEVDMVMVWVNADNPQETLECPWYSQGVDIAGEKGVGKAYTYGEKYFLLKFFNIPTDDLDPDAFQDKHSDDKQPPKGNVRELPQKPATGQPKAPQTQPDKIPDGQVIVCERCLEEITESAVVAFSKNKFSGKVYCRKCQKVV